jgi:hypothetical protein
VDGGMKEGHLNFWAGSASRLIGPQ